MKKKSILLSATLLFALLLSACGGKGTEPTQKVSDAGVSQNIIADTPAPTEDVKDHESTDPFDAFKDKLSQGGFSYETVTMAAELVGAQKGEKYKFSFGSVELYLFEDESEALNAAKENGGLTLEGFGVFPCEFNGNLAMLIDVTESEDQIQEIFISLT